MSGRRAIPYAAQPIAVALKDAPRYSGLPYSTLLDAARDGRLRCHVYGNGRHRHRYLVKLVDLDAYVESLSLAHKVDGEVGP